ncbi:histidinol-phosphate transaminase [Methanobrevibacter sp. 87.7]|uniref:histidinol-phosphate transaminase n=1 Tax=Methanobrevibacter sp. 87.7 TaxID=387957 RepID=UPI000B504DA5|nr:histidinol-phosphate transaminase [Methanobrevibacter sp. 87.7]OWT33270.1 histidinol-phosphate transaminase [Methanobrevibacter sp. 87.7]
MNARDVVKELDPYVPGRSEDEIANEFGLNKEDIIKLGSNENPWEPSEKAIEAIKKEADNVNRYPETDLEELREEFAKYANVKTENVIVSGDGADEIIDVLAKTFINPGDEFIVPLPTYTYYEFLFKPYGAIPVYAKWNMNNNTLDVQSVLNAISDKTKMIFICSPNNPSGAVVNEEDLRTIIEATDALVVIDEAYFEYSEQTQSKLINDYSNVFIIRTMSKVMGLAGLRIGYGLADSETIDYMLRVKPVFSLTRLSYVAAMATLKDKEFIKYSTSKGIESRDYLYEEVSKFKTLSVFKSKSNFMLIDLHDSGYTAAELTHELMKKGVIVRDCTSFKGIDNYWIRISIATLEEDKKFIDILHTIVE